MRGNFVGPGAVAAVLVIAGAAFVAGRWTRSPAPAATPPARTGAAAATSDGAAPAARVPPAAPESGTDGPGATGTSGPTPAEPVLSPERKAALQKAFDTVVADRRAEVLALCWPESGLPGGRTKTTLTYNVTFDPSGREIARGILDDRRAPAGAFKDCLSQRPEGAFTIPPPGAYVTLRATVTYP